MARNLEFPSPSYSRFQPSHLKNSSTHDIGGLAREAIVESLKSLSLQDQKKDSEYQRIRKEYRAIKKYCLELGINFTDEDFPAIESSVFPSSRWVSAYYQDDDRERFWMRRNSIVSWQRPRNINLTRRDGDTDNSEDWLLIENAHPSDICQGELGNCWFIAALTLIAEKTELLSKIFISKTFNPAGVYALRLFKDGKWKGVLIDDLFPCDAHNRLVFSSCKKKQLWVPLIEKAMSKLHGSYASLQAGHISDGLNYLTGFVSERIDFKAEKDHDLLWARLLSFHDAGFLMGTHIIINEASQVKYYKESKGLIANHVYSVLKVVCMENNRLVQLRNPWGRFSWKGDWSDESPLWTEVMSAYLSPHRSGEGIFWMSYQDFTKIFTGLEVCKVRQNWMIYSLEGIFPPYADPDCQPCFELICEEPCEVDISLYQSSKRNARESVQQTDIGLMIFVTNGCSSSSKSLKLLKPVELVMSSKQRVVSCNLMLATGKYLLVPFSFGHWSENAKHEMFYNFTLTIHSSRDLNLYSIHPPNILADALICCSKYFGDRQHFSLRKHSEDISIISMNLGWGQCTVLENFTDDMFVELEVDCKTVGDYSSTRNAFWTLDKIPPRHCQVVQVIVPKETGKASSYSYQIQVGDRFSKLNKRHSSSGDFGHQPMISERIAGLHGLRKTKT